MDRGSRAASCAGVPRDVFPAVVIIGTRPTFGDRALGFEVTSQGSQAELYGKPMQVSYGYLRQEQIVSRMPPLKSQVALDVERASCGFPKGSSFTVLGPMIECSRRNT